MPENSCKVNKTEDIVKSFLQAEEYCGVCRRNFNGILKLLGIIREGEAQHDYLDIIDGLAGEVVNLCHCGKGLPVAGEVISLLRDNLGDFVAHIENRVCPSSQCPKLILAPCQAACPAGIDIPNYVALVGMGKYEEALELIREDVPLPGTLGRICEHPCEKACRRGEVDTAISICALKRLSYDKSNESGNKPPAPPEKKYAEKIAVVGSGPAGLSAAYFLSRMGYQVTIFEAMSKAGGMLAYGIPPYRLPREVLRNEISYIEAMGVEIKLNSPIFGEYGINALKKEGYAAVFLSTGAWKGIKPNIPNLEKFKDVLDGVTFLREVNEGILTGSGEKPAVVEGKKVVVVGGGNVAIDTARVSLRLGAQEVRIIYRRTREEMPALYEEIVDAEKEGVVFDYLISPVNVGGKDGRVSYLECLRNALSEPDESGRRRPVPVNNSEFKIEADVIIFATGQQPALSYLKEKSQVSEVEVSKNRIVANSLTMETSVPGVFAGGDAVTGPATVVKAIAAGKRAAAGMDAHLRGKKLSDGINYPTKRKSTLPLQVSAEQKASSSLINFHDLYVNERKNTFNEILQRVGEEDAFAEAARCLRCDICIACGACVDNCRNKVGADAIQLGFIHGNKGSETDFGRPGDKCIGCGTCSVNCPTGAITMKEDQEGFREVRMCGTLMSRVELVSCQECGQNFAAAKHLEYVARHIKDHFGQVHHNKNICPDCARKVWSRNVYGMVTG